MLGTSELHGEAPCCLLVAGASLARVSRLPTPKGSGLALYLGVCVCSLNCPQIWNVHFPYKKYAHLFPWSFAHSIYILSVGSGDQWTVSGFDVCVCAGGKPALTRWLPMGEEEKEHTENESYLVPNTSPMITPGHMMALRRSCKDHLIS